MSKHETINSRYNVWHHYNAVSRCRGVWLLRAGWYECPDSRVPSLTTLLFTTLIMGHESGQALSPRVPQRNIRVNSVSIYQHVCRRLSWFSVSSAQPFPVFIERISLHKEQIRGGASFLFFFNASLISRRGKIDTTRLVMRELPHRARGAGSDSNTGIAIDCFGY